MQTKSVGVQGRKERPVVLGGWGKPRGGITEEGASELDLILRRWIDRVSRGLEVGKCGVIQRRPNQKGLVILISQL